MNLKSISDHIGLSLSRLQLQVLFAVHGVTLLAFSNFFSEFSENEFTHTISEVDECVGYMNCKQCFIIYCIIQQTDFKYSNSLQGTP